MQSMMVALLRSPLHPPLSKSLLLLGFDGRKSGRRYQIPVAYVQDGSNLLIASRARWWKNLTGGAPVTVLLRGRNLSATADVPEDTAQRLAVLRRILRGSKQLAGFMEVSIDQAGEPHPRELAAAVERGWVAVVVHLPQP
jgi:hypothetical protein